MSFLLFDTNKIEEVEKLGRYFMNQSTIPTGRN